MTTDFIQPESSANIIAAIVEAMQKQLPTWMADESDPGVYWADAVADAISDFADKINIGLLQAFAPTATGLGLDALAADVGLTREDGETDEHLRARYRRQWFAVRPDTPEYYAELAHLWDESEGHDPPLVYDVAAQFIPHFARTFIFVFDSDLNPLTTQQYESLTAWLNSTALRPLYMTYEAEAPETSTYSIYVGVYMSDEVLNHTLALAQVQSTTQEWLNSIRRLNTAVALSDLIVLLRSIPGIENAIVNFIGTTNPGYLPPIAGVLHSGRIGRIVDLTL